LISELKLLTKPGERQWLLLWVYRENAVKNNKLTGVLVVWDTIETKMKKVLC
jgi:hypothetical protein